MFLSKRSFGWRYFSWAYFSWGVMTDVCRSDGNFTHGMAGLLGPRESLMLHGGWIIWPIFLYDLGWIWMLMELIWSSVK
jgi:hypothetical protein